MPIGQNPLMGSASFSLSLCLSAASWLISRRSRRSHCAQTLTLTDESDADAAVLFSFFFFSAQRQIVSPYEVANRVPVDLHVDVSCRFSFTSWAEIRGRLLLLFASYPSDLHYCALESRAAATAPWQILERVVKSPSFHKGSSGGHQACLFTPVSRGAGGSECSLFLIGR